MTEDIKTGNSSQDVENKSKGGKRFVKISISVHKDTEKIIRAVVEKRGMTSVSDFFRELFRNYYENEFRIKYKGYHVGLDTIYEKASRDEKKKEISSVLAEFEKMSNEDATQFLIEIGFLTPENLEEGSWLIMENPDDNNKRWLYFFYGGMKASKYSWDQLVREVEKILKEKNK